MIELLSPAGNKESAIAAINAGANAVYMGLNKYSARAMAENFDINQYIDIIDYAHIYGVKVYLTLNTLLYDDELIDALQLLCRLYNSGLDAVIVQDIGFASIVKKYLPDLPLHASTQMTVHSLKQVKFLESLGFTRIVLAREMTFEEIKYIAENSNIELEVFIHGALCVSYSGQCLMSSMIGSRSGNRGKCAGSCRLPMKLYKGEKKIISGHLLSKKDIYGLEYVNRLKEIGITSLKIEGRGKTKEYISLVTRKYRKCIDEGKMPLEDEKQLLQMFNRTSKSSGYFDSAQKKESISYKVAKNTGLLLGSIIESKNNMVKVKLEEDIDMHDGVEVFGEEKEISTIVTCIKDEKKNILNREVKRGNIVWLGDFKTLPKKEKKIYKTSSKSLILNEQKYAKEYYRKAKVKVDLKIKLDSKIEVTAFLRDIAQKIYIDLKVEKAIKNATSKEDIAKALDKNVDIPFVYEISALMMDDDIFLPVSSLNEIRRKITEVLIDRCKVRKETKIDFEGIKLNEVKEKNHKLNIDSTLFVYRFKEENIAKYNSYNAQVIYINISDILKINENILEKLGPDIFVYLPNVILKNLEKKIDSSLEEIVKNTKVKGVLLGSLNYISRVLELKKKYGFKVFLDYSLNVNNVCSALFFKNMGIDLVTLSPELSQEEICEISKHIDVEVVTDYVTVMTMRYCVISSFDKCNCKNYDYILRDSYGNSYNIITDTNDCISKYVRSIPKNENITVGVKRKCDIS